MKNFLIKFIKNQSGQSLVELLIAIGLTSILIPAILSGIIASRGGRAQNEQRVAAVAVLKNTQEAVRSIYLSDWAEIENNGTYYPIILDENWVLNSGSQNEGGFTTSVEIGDVYRDSGGTITTSGGIIDPSTKEVLITVSWDTPFASSISSTNYFTRFINFAHLETTLNDFTPGATSSGTYGITITEIIDGEVTLGAGGSGDWCKPNESILEELDYPGQAEARALSAIEGRIFTGTGRNASGLPFGHITVSNTNPPEANLVGSYSSVSPPKTNDVFGEASYAYIGTDSNLREIIIIDLTTNPYSEIGYFDPSGNNRGISVFVVGNVGYMTTESGNTFRTFDLTSKSGSRPQLDQVTLSGRGNSIYIRDDYAYVAVNSTTTQFQIVNVSNPSDIQVVGSLPLSNVAGQDVFVNEAETRAFVATSYSSSNPEFYIIDITDKSNPEVISGGSYDTGAMSPTGLRVVPGGRAIVVGETGGQRYQVVNITDENSPEYCGGLNISSNIYAIDAVLEDDGDAYSYIATAESSAELKIIEGGPGGSFTNEGVFESFFFDAGETVAFNRIVQNFINPDSTIINFQVASADAIGNSCESANYNFVGPDGTSSTNFTSVGLVPLLDNGSGFKNPGRCFKYKVFFSTSDQFASPVLYDFSVNYSL